MNGAPKCTSKQAEPICHHLIQNHRPTYCTLVCLWFAIVNPHFILCALHVKAIAINICGGMRGFKLRDPICLHPDQPTTSLISQATLWSIKQLSLCWLGSAGHGMVHSNSKPSSLVWWLKESKYSHDGIRYNRLCHNSLHFYGIRHNRFMYVIVFVSHQLPYVDNRIYITGCVVHSNITWPVLLYILPHDRFCRLCNACWLTSSLISCTSLAPMHAHNYILYNRLCRCIYVTLVTVCG